MTDIRDPHAVTLDEMRSFRRARPPRLPGRQGRRPETPTEAS